MQATSSVAEFMVDVAGVETQPCKWAKNFLLG
jgi:hypothetical protein